MADIPLKSFTFPGLSDKYTTPVVDNTLAVAGAAADAKKTGDEIGAIKNDLSDGTFIVNNAENAEQLTSTVGIEDNAPYLFRTSGGSNDIGDREDVRKIVGGTIVNNQLMVVRSDTFTKNGVTATPNGDGSLTISGTATEDAKVSFGVSPSFGMGRNIGHKYLISGCKGGSASTYYATILYIGESTKDYGNGAIYNATDTQYSGTFGMIVANGVTIDVTVKPMIIDLTLDFGTAIADYVYNLEQATAGAGVAWLKTHFPKQFDSGYQAFDAGTLKSIEGLSGKKTVGFNQWDEQYLNGFYTLVGVFNADSNYVCCKNKIPVLPNTVYNQTSLSGYMGRICFYDADENFISTIASYVGENITKYVFTTPSNAKYMTFDMKGGYGGTYKHDICINLHWDGEKDGQYEPYKEYTYALDSSVTLRGIPKVDASGNLYYDGDEYLPDGTVNRRYREIDFGGSEEWVLQSINEHGIANFSFDIGGYGNIQNSRCNRFALQTSSIASTTDEGYLFAANQYLFVRISSSKASTVAEFKTWLADNLTEIIYELATPTTETALPYQETQIVDDFGTEEFVLADGAFPVPVGHNTMYQNNLRAKLEMSPDSPDGDGLYVVQQESGENTYVPLASTATIQDILTRLTALENA